MKKVKKTLKLLLLLLIFSGARISFAQPASEILKEVMARYHTIKTQSAAFTQIKHISFLEDSLVSEGEFYFKEPDKMVWKYTTPFFYSVIINGDSVSIVDDKKVKSFDAAENLLFAQIKRVIFNMVSGKILNDTTYLIKPVDRGSYLEVQFTPNDETMRKYLKRIDLWFDKKEKEVVKIKMNESSGDETVIFFENRKTNTPLSDDLFRP